MNKLREIYEEGRALYGESPESFSDKGSIHTYIDTYYDLLKDKKYCKIFEIGVRTGGSIWLWRKLLEDYEIWGIDVDSNYFANRPFADELRNDPKIIVKFRRNSFDVSSYDDIPKDFDLIIDDGDHSAEGICKTFINAWHHLKTGGVYVIEDPQTDEAINTITNKIKEIAPSSEISILKFRPDSDDNLIIVNKKEN